MNGVTLISETGASSSSPPVFEADAHRTYSAALGRRALRAADRRSRDQVAADEAHDLRRAVAEQSAIAGDRAREDVEDHHRRNGGRKAERGREQRFGDAGRDDREVCRLRLRDADEAVHDAPYGAEQADEGPDGTDGRENAGAAVHPPAGCRLDAFEPRGDTFLHAVLFDCIGRELDLGFGRPREAAMGPPVYAQALVPSCREWDLCERANSPVRAGAWRPATRCSWRATRSSSAPKQAQG